MKAYVKPELFYERYELSQHIATCGIDVSGFNSIETCNVNLDYDFWGMSDSVFSDGATKCGIDISVIEAYCYTTGETDARKVFCS